MTFTELYYKFAHLFPTYSAYGETNEMYVKVNYRGPIIFISVGYNYCSHTYFVIVRMNSGRHLSENQLLLDDCLSLLANYSTDERFSLH